MPERWFRVPLVEEEEEDGRLSRRGKYGELAEEGVSYTYISEASQVIALFRAEEETLNEVAEKDDVESLSEVEATQLQQTSDTRVGRGTKTKASFNRKGE